MSWRSGGDGRSIQIPAEHWERVFGSKTPVMGRCPNRYCEDGCGICSNDRQEDTTLVPAEPVLIIQGDTQDIPRTVLYPTD